MSRLSFSIGLVALACLLASPADAQVTYELVTVGNAGNATDPATGGTYGGVAYDFRIGKYEVTIGQYTEFLNAVAKTDTYGLYNTSMGSNLNVAGIAQSGSPGSYTYSVMTVSGSAPYGGVTNANRPITYVSWFDAARFANWMANGQPTGIQTGTTTENGAYDLANWTSGTAPAKNVTNPNTGLEPSFYIPLEDEWYKAAYYSPLLNSGSGGYYTYATQGNTPPGNVPGSGANQANSYSGFFSVTQSAGYSSSQNYLTDVGAFTDSASFYGTFDQSGNVSEWNDLIGVSAFSRGLRDGNWFNDALLSSSSFRIGYDASYEANVLGFRLASPVPEPGTLGIASGGAMCAGGWWGLKRRRKRA